MGDTCRPSSTGNLLRFPRCLAGNRTKVIQQRQSNKRPNLLRDLLTSHEVYSRGRKAKATLVWIPAHLGIEGNEQADIVGRDGALVESITFNWRVVGSTPALAVT